MWQCLEILHCQRGRETLSVPDPAVHNIASRWQEWAGCSMGWKDKVHHTEKCKGCSMLRKNYLIEIGLTSTASHLFQMYKWMAFPPNLHDDYNGHREDPEHFQHKWNKFIKLYTCHQCIFMRNISIYRFRMSDSGVHTEASKAKGVDRCCKEET